jgi:hypothetical protein
MSFPGRILHLWDGSEEILHDSTPNIQSMYFGGILNNNPEYSEVKKKKRRNQILVSTKIWWMCLQNVIIRLLGLLKHKLN